jgi:hypothetical protein
MTRVQKYFRTHSIDLSDETFSFHILAIAMLFTQIHLLRISTTCDFFLLSMKYHQYEQKRRQKKIRKEARGRLYDDIRNLSIHCLNKFKRKIRSNMMI